MNPPPFSKVRARLQVLLSVHDHYVWHDSFICVTWLIHMCDMTHTYVWPLSHSCVARDSFVCVWHDSFICVTWLVHACDMPHSCVWHDSFEHMTCLMHTCAVTLSVRAIWPIHVCVPWLAASTTAHRFMGICIQIHIYMNIYAYIYVYLNICIHI